MSNVRAFLKGIGRNVLLLGLVSLFTDLSSQMIFPLIPLYLTSLGAGAALVGLVEGAAETTSSLLKVFSGFLSDRFKKRKIFILLGYGISTVTKPLFALAHVWPVVLGIRVIERIGKGMRDAPRDALVAESTHPDVLGRAYGVQRMMDGLGSVLGTVLSVILFPLLGYQKIFLFAFLPGIIALLIILFVQEKKILQAEGYVRHEPIKYRVNILEARRILPKRLLLFLGVAMLFAFANFDYTFLLLKAKNIGITDHFTLILYMLFYGAYSLVAIPAGSLSDKIGRKTVLVAGYSLFLVVAGLLAFVQTFAWVLVCFVLFGMLYAMIDATQRALVVDLAGDTPKGTALGTFYMAIGLVALPGGYILGRIWEVSSPQVMFLVSGGLVAVALVLLVTTITGNKIRNK